MHSYNLNVFELNIAFKTEADSARVENACAYAENLYEALKFHGSHLGRDRLLTILVLGVVDDLLQLKQQTAEKDNRIASLLQSIEKKERPSEPLGDASNLAT